MKIQFALLFFLMFAFTYGQTVEMQSNENQMDFEFKANRKIKNKFKENILVNSDIQIFAEIENDSLINIYIKNCTKETLNLSIQDSKLHLIQEAKNENGEWKPIEYWKPAWCGNSYGDETIKSNKIIKTQSYNYNGEIETEIRFKLLYGKTYYSNSLKGRINLEQFILSEKGKKESRYYTYESIAGKDIAEKVIFLEPNGAKEFLEKQKEWKKELIEKNKNSNN